MLTVVYDDQNIESQEYMIYGIPVMESLALAVLELLIFFEIQKGITIVSKSQ